jgi:hypothetical protein
MALRLFVRQDTAVLIGGVDANRQLLAEDAATVVVVVVEEIDGVACCPLENDAFDEL